VRLALRQVLVKQVGLRRLRRGADGWACAPRTRASSLCRSHFLLVGEAFIDLNSVSCASDASVLSNGGRHGDSCAAGMDRSRGESRVRVSARGTLRYCGIVPTQFAS
jgi:hypothetical protein